MPNAARGSKVNFITLLTVDEEGKARHSLRNIAKRLAPGRTRASGKQSIPSTEVSWLAWVGSKGSVTITEGGTQKTLLEELASGMHLQAPRLVREGTPGRRNSMSKSAAAGSARMLSGARGQRTRGSTPDSASHVGPGSARCLRQGAGRALPPTVQQGHSQEGTGLR